MDIGTAKPTGEERALVPHHLVDIIEPDKEFSLAEYQRLAYGPIQDIQRRERCLSWWRQRIVCLGGSGRVGYPKVHRMSFSARDWKSGRIGGGEKLYRELNRLTRLPRKD